jgi:hypothetical protein
MGKSTPARANTEAPTSLGVSPAALRASRTQERIAPAAASIPTSSQLAGSWFAPIPSIWPEESARTAWQ